MTSWKSPSHVIRNEAGDYLPIFFRIAVETFNVTAPFGIPSRLRRLFSFIQFFCMRIWDEFIRLRMDE